MRPSGPFHGARFSIDDEIECVEDLDPRLDGASKNELPELARESRRTPSVLFGLDLLRLEERVGDTSDAVFGLA